MTLALVVAIAVEAALAEGSFPREANSTGALPSLPPSAGGASSAAETPAAKAPAAAAHPSVSLRGAVATGSGETSMGPCDDNPWKGECDEYRCMWQCTNDFPFGTNQMQCEEGSYPVKGECRQYGCAWSCS